MKKNVSLGLMAIVLIFGLIGCNGGNRLSGTWECDDGCGETITFSGKNFTYTFPGGRVDRGTYSISGNSIEIIENGHIEVFGFSRTENTINIQGWGRYIRRR